MNDMARRLKQVEGLNGELQRKVDELTHDLQQAQGDNSRLNAELARLKVVVNDLTDRNDGLARENKNLSGRRVQGLDDSVERSSVKDTFSLSTKALFFF